MKFKYEQFGVKYQSIILNLFKNPFFIFILILKIFLGLFFISEIPSKLFIPFLSYFGETLNNPYSYFFENGITEAFPYPPLMLLIMGVPFVIFSFINSSLTLSTLDLFILRLPLLVFDIILLVFLMLLNLNNQKKILYLYWGSPIVIYINYLHGQLDIIPITFLIMSLYFLTKKRFFISALLIALSLATKSHIIIALPFYLLYLIKKKYDFFKITAYFGTFLFFYAFLLLPLLFSKGFINLVFLSKEQFKLFNLSILFGDGISFYIIIALYLYLVFKAYSVRKITKNLLIMFISITFTLFVTLVAPSPGWFMWIVPFLVYYISKEQKNIIVIYWCFNILYLIYYAINRNSDIFQIFQLINPNIANTNIPIIIIENILNIDGNILISIIFTTLSSSLLYLTYLMFKYSLKSSLIFQEKSGIPTIGISGDSGSGKSTTRNLIKKLLGNDEVNVIYGDDVHKWERGDSNWDKFTHLNPLSNKIHKHYEHINILKKGNPIYRSHYDHSTGKFTEEQLIKPKNYIIDEGLHTFLIDNKRLHDIKIYMEPDKKLNIHWKIERDMKKRGHSKKKIMESLEKRKPDSEKFISPQKNNADLIISLKDNNNNYNDLVLEVLLNTKISIEPLLEMISNKSNLDFNFEYTSTEKQKIICKSNISKSEIIEIMKNLPIDNNEYGIKFKHIENGINGIIQLIIIYCLNENLISNSEAENGY